MSKPLVCLLDEIKQDEMRWDGLGCSLVMGSKLEEEVNEGSAGRDWS